MDIKQHQRNVLMRGQGHLGGVEVGGLDDLDVGEGVMQQQAQAVPV